MIEKSLVALECFFFYTSSLFFVFPLNYIFPLLFFCSFRQRHCWIDISRNEGANYPVGQSARLIQVINPISVIGQHVRKNSNAPLRAVGGLTW